MLNCLFNEREMKKRLGLIGFPLGHSFSPKYFKTKFDCDGIKDWQYKAYPIASVDGFKHLEKDQLKGLNVTIPYKQSIIPFLDELRGAANEIKAVNTVLFTEEFKIGYNTDVHGFEHSLVPLLDSEKVYKALILGSGGASNAVCYVLQLLGIEYTIVSRFPKEKDLSYKSLDAATMDKHHLIINTTPLGMYPNVKQKPNIPYQFLGEHHILYDLVYNPEKTLFLKLGEKQGSKTKNGLEMLELQAEKSWEIWNSK